METLEVEVQERWATGHRVVDLNVQVGLRKFRTVRAGERVTAVDTEHTQRQLRLGMLKRVDAPAAKPAAAAGKPQEAAT